MISVSVMTSQVLVCLLLSDVVFSAFTCLCLLFIVVVCRGCIVVCLCEVKSEADSNDIT